MALAEVDLDVAEGEVVGLVGPNGSGKTTLLGIVCGLLAADQGNASVFGAPAGSTAARRRLAVVPDEPAGFDELTVSEYAALLQGLHAAEGAATARLATLLDAFRLEGRRHTRLGALSRGLRRQASIVAALALGTPLLVVDEATATLDPEAVVVLRSALRARRRRGGAALVATQDLAFAASVCDRLVLLDRGRVLDAGTPEELRVRRVADTLEEAFLAAVGRPALEHEAGVLLASL